MMQWNNATKYLVNEHPFKIGSIEANFIFLIKNKMKGEKKGKLAQNKMCFQPFDAEPNVGSYKF